MIWCSGQNDKSDSTYERDKEPRKIRPGRKETEGNRWKCVCSDFRGSREWRGESGKSRQLCQPLTGLANLHSCLSHQVTLAGLEDPFACSHFNNDQKILFFFLPLQDADSGWSLSSASGSVWAAASPQSAVSRYTPRGKVRGTKSDTHNSIAETCPPPKTKHELAQSHLCEIQSIQKIIVLPCCLPHRADHNFPHHKSTAGHCVLCLCCRELSYNQIEDLPSFYHCSALQEMWVFRPPRQSHTYCIKGSSFLSLPLHIVLWLHIILYHFPNRGLQHNQIRRIESSTFQQLTSLRALWVNLYFVLVTSCMRYI